MTLAAEIATGDLGHLRDHEILHGQALNVEAFGAAGDNSTDNAPAFQSAIDELPSNGGGTIVVPPGRYRFSSSVSTTKAGVRLLGMGGPSYNESSGQYTGATLIADSGVTRLLDLAPTALGHRGPTLENLNFIDAAGTDATLVRIKLFNRWTVRNCSFRDGAVGLEIDSDNATWGGATTGGDASWGVVDQCFFRRNTIGMNVPRTGGFVILGGDFSQTTGQTGVYIEGGSQHRLLGVKFDNGAYAVHCKGNVSLIACEFENQSTACVKLDGAAIGDDGRGQRMISCTFNPDTGVGAYGLHIASGVRAAPMMMDTFWVNTTYKRIHDEAGVGIKRGIDNEGAWENVLTITPTSSATTLAANHDIVLCNMTNATGSGLTVNLPTVGHASTPQKGRKLVLKKTDASANAVNVKGASSETIDGATTHSLSAQYDKVTVVCDGTNWVTV